MSMDRWMVKEDVIYMYHVGQKVHLVSEYIVQLSSSRKWKMCLLFLLKTEWTFWPTIHTHTHTHTKWTITQP